MDYKRIKVQLVDAFNSQMIILDEALCQRKCSIPNKATKLQMCGKFNVF